MGALVWDRVALPFGATHSEAGLGGGTALRLPGQLYDAETGYHYNYFRDYDPSTGRYLQPDPIGLQGGLNRYGYVGGNPVKFVDPLGLGPKGAAIGGGVGAVIGGVVGGAGGLVFCWFTGPGVLVCVDLGVGGGATLGAGLGAAAGSFIEEQCKKLLPNVVYNQQADDDAHSGRPKINEDRQGKHQPGHKNYQPGRSELTDPDPQGLLDQHHGTGEQKGSVPVGEPGSKEVVDFGKEIGVHVDPITGARSPTSKGTIHYGKQGAHIVPARPR